MEASELKSLIPEPHRAALLRAVEWTPKSRSWHWSLSRSYDAVLKGRKPIALGWDTENTRREARRRGLIVHQGTTIVSLPATVSLAKTAAWLYEPVCPLEEWQRHYLRGVLLGYPIEDAWEWASTWALERGIEIDYKRSESL